MFNKILVLLLYISVTRTTNCLPVGDVEEEIDLSEYGAKIFGEPSSKSGESVKEWQVSSNANPEEYSEYLEGDILIPVNRSAPSRNGMVAQSYRWQNAVIPYEIVGSFDSRSMNLIRNAMQTYHQKTCIRFRPRTNADRDYIR